MLCSACQACLICHASSCALRSVSAASLSISVCLLLLPYSLQALLESLRLLAIESAAHQKPLSYRGFKLVHHVTLSNYLFKAFSCLKQRSRAYFWSLQVPQNLAMGCSWWQVSRSSICCRTGQPD